VGQIIATQHPAVVLRSRYLQLRALLVVAMIAVIGLTAAVVILATDDGGTVTGATSASQVEPTTSSGPNESAVAAAVSGQPSSGPDESAVAAAVGGQTSSGPDESSIAAALGRRAR
jgi:hypothetical protein